MTSYTSRYSNPAVLTDFSRLDEIYKLRVFAWENSPGKKQLNSTQYAHGFRDNLEEKSVHYISVDKNNRIIGSARLTLCMRIDDLPYPDLFKKHEQKMPPKRPFLLYSRLVIHPDFRKKGLRKEFDLVRIRKQLDMNIPFGLVVAKPKRLLQIIPYGYKALGETHKTFDYNNPLESRNALILNLDEIKIPIDIQ